MKIRTTNLFDMTLITFVIRSDPKKMDIREIYPESYFWYILIRGDSVTIKSQDGWRTSDSSGIITRTLLELSEDEELTFYAERLPSFRGEMITESPR